MRNVIILHAPSEAAVAADLVLGHSEIWVASAVTKASAAGAFGPRFRLVAIWSAAAAAAGLAPVYEAMFANRDEPSVILKLDETPIPALLANVAAAIGRADLRGLSTALALQGPSNARPTPGERRIGLSAAMRALAAVALSLGFGAVLANATAIERRAALSAEFGFAPVAPRLATPAAAPAAPIAADDAVSARAQAMFERADSVARSPAAAARARTVDQFHASPD